LLDGIPLSVELESEITIGSDESMQTSSHTVSIHLETMAQSWLNDSLTSLYLFDETMRVR
jgi:hypothetical protein